MNADRECVARAAGTVDRILDVGCYGSPLKSAGAPFIAPTQGIDTRSTAEKGAHRRPADEAQGRLELGQKGGS